MDTVLYAASAASLTEPRAYEAAYRAVSEERRRKTDRLRRPEDRRLSLCAGLLLRYGLREAGAVHAFGSDAADSDAFDPNAFHQDALDPNAFGPKSSDEPEIAYGPQGKPRLKNGGPCFNLSHSGEYAFCAVSPNEVGCDVERIGNADLTLAKRFFCPEEAAFLASRETEEERNRTFARYWTLKESFLKVTGLGMKLPLNAFRIELPPVYPAKSGIAAVQTDAGRDFSEIFCGKEYRFAEFADLPGYACAVCTLGGASYRMKRMEIAELL